MRHLATILVLIAWTLPVGSAIVQLDRAFLRDPGFSTVPEPSAILLALVRRRNMATAFA